MIPELEKIWEHLCVCIKVKRCSDGVLTQKRLLLTVNGIATAPFNIVD